MVIASEATTKNQPPDIDTIMFHTSAGMANGTSTRQKRIHGEKWKQRVASSSWNRSRLVCAKKVARPSTRSTASTSQRVGTSPPLSTDTGGAPRVMDRDSDLSGAPEFVSRAGNGISSGL